MDTSNIAKWVDELSGEIAQLKRAIANAGGGSTAQIDSLYSNSALSPTPAQTVVALSHKISDYDIIVITTEVYIDSRPCVGSFAFDAKYLTTGKSARLIGYEAYNIYMVLDITADNSITVGLNGNSEFKLKAIDGYRFTEHPTNQTRKRGTKK